MKFVARNRPTATAGVKPAVLAAVEMLTLRLLL